MVKNKGRDLYDFDSPDYGFISKNVMPVTVTAMANVVSIRIVLIHLLVLMMRMTLPFSI